MQTSSHNSSTLNKDGTTIIYSSHRMEHVEELCDDVCILNKGELVVSGPIDQVKSNHGNKNLKCKHHHIIPQHVPFDVSYK